MLRTPLRADRCMNVQLCPWADPGIERRHSDRVLLQLQHCISRVVRCDEALRLPLTLLRISLLLGQGLGVFALRYALHNLSNPNHDLHGLGLAYSCHSHLSEITVRVKVRLGVRARVRVALILGLGLGCR